MSRFIIFVIFFWGCVLSNANAVSIIAKQKYPYQLLTEDYGILNENDLGGYAWGMNPKPFSEKDSGALNYWQCFRRDQVSIILTDTGELSDDLSPTDPVGDLRIRVTIKSGVVHEYEMRREWSVNDFQKDFDLWRKLMKGEKYVCLGGNFVDREKTVENGKPEEIYGWIFDKIKTKKGCAGYFDDCNLTYQQYRKNEET